MSHFTVMVIGENPDHELAPFHEFEYTGDDNEFVQNVDRTQEVIDAWNKTDKSESVLEYAESECGWEPVATGDKPDLAGKHKYGYIVVNENGQLVKAIDRTNPNKKWDWWTIGGRWRGFLTHIDGREVDQARKSDIDWNGMRKAKKSMATFAYLIDRQWHEKGRMGWFGHASGKKDEASWEREFEEMLESLPSNSLITIVDCHT